MIKDAGGTASFAQADVSRAQEVEVIVARMIETYSRIDCAFNNAGIEDTPSGTSIAAKTTSTHYRDQSQGCLVVHEIPHHTDAEARQ